MEPLVINRERYINVKDLPKGVSLGHNYIGGKPVGSNSLYTRTAGRHLAGAAAFTNTVRVKIISYIIKDGMYFFQDEEGKVYKGMITYLYTNPSYTQMKTFEDVEKFLTKRRVPLI